jgi:hypothetical protein
MYRQDPPNAGMPLVAKVLSNVDADNGFDIGGNSKLRYLY